MPESWLLFPSGPGLSAHNMAVDEALLEVVHTLGKPVLRFYGWVEPAATFGYFQHYESVAALTRLRPLLRRPTGGGLVPHDADWTYSLAFPPGHFWYEDRASESYRRLHEWVRAGFTDTGLATELAPCCTEDGPGQCFVGAEQFDLLWQGQKIAGAAQRRRRDGMLIQGSIQPPAFSQRGAWEEAFIRAATAQWAVQWKAWQPGEDFWRHVQILERSRYGRPEYHQRR